MRYRKTKTALVLAGGGITGAVYEIGALRAIDDILIDRTVNDFDIYVGTSAGALVASFIANGVSPETMFQVIDGANTETRGIERKHLFHFNFRDFLASGARLPVKFIEAWSHYLRHSHDMTLFDLVWSLSEVMPPGFYDARGLEDFVRASLLKMGYQDSFDDLAKELYIIATDLDSGSRAVFGRNRLEAPVSRAVAASSAVPLLYKPVKIGNNEYIDGGTRGNASIDLAIEQGAELVVCINPLVPYDNTERDKIPFLGPDGGNLSQKGVQTIANQAFRIMLHSGLHYHIKQLRRTHPEVDIILIEPKREDYQMFFYNIMRYSARLIVARHGFETVTINLSRDFAQIKEVMARHDIPITQRLVMEELKQIEQSEDDSDVIRQILEARSPYCAPKRRNTPLCQLNRSLAELELALEKMTAEKPGSNSPGKIG